MLILLSSFYTNLSSFSLQGTNLVQQMLYLSDRYPSLNVFQLVGSTLQSVPLWEVLGWGKWGRSFLVKPLKSIAFYKLVCVHCKALKDACLKDKFSSQGYGVQVIFLSCFVFFALLAVAQIWAMRERETRWFKNLSWNACQCLPLCPEGVEGSQSSKRAVKSNDYKKSKTFSSKE